CPHSGHGLPCGRATSRYPHSGHREAARLVSLVETACVTVRQGYHRRAPEAHAFAACAMFHVVRFATSCMLFLALLGAAPGDTTTTDRPLAIHVAPEGWGSAPPQNVEAVLRSAADALLVHLPEHGIEIIHVRGGSGPIVLYQRAEDGGYQVRLNTRDTYWAQYAF